METIPVESISDFLFFGIPICVVGFVVLLIVDDIFGPSPETREAQRRLYEDDERLRGGHRRQRFEDAVQQEMERIRSSRDAERDSLRRQRRSQDIRG